MPKHSRKRSRSRGRAPLSRRQVRKVQTIASKTVKKLSEWKYHTISLGLATPISSGSITQSLLGVTQGDTRTTRDGDIIFPSTISFKYDIVPEDATNIVRVILYQFFQPSTPTISDVLDLSTPVAANHWTSPYERKFAHDYKIIYDRVHTVDTAAHTVYATGGKRRIPRARTTFEGATIVDPVGGVYLSAISDSTVGAGPKINWTSRINFRDG